MATVPKRRFIMAALLPLLLLTVGKLSGQGQSPKVIHIMVALCDNAYQGIVRVPAKIGNGQDPHNNLYWGCGYGVRTYFRRSAEWTEVKQQQKTGPVLERCVFKHKNGDWYIVADAYDGMYIRTCTRDLLSSCAGAKKGKITVDGIELPVYGNAAMIAYIGHNGLMDFSLTDNYISRDGVQRDVVILGCRSREYFSKYLTSAKSNPVLWTTGNMAPEAYTLHDAISVYIKAGTPEEMREAAAGAYNKYQKCGLNGAKRLLVHGF